jgi:hypothetical protein
VSVSTLRRRIKAEDISFRFNDGKYYICDKPIESHQREHRPSPKGLDALMGQNSENTSTERRVSDTATRTSPSSSASVQSPSSPPSFSSFTEPTSHRSFENESSNMNKATDSDYGSELEVSPLPENTFRYETMTDEPILAAANELLAELKKAYMLILSEKEEQILHLREEVADLKTLVRVLEGENDRLRAEVDFLK